MYNSAPKKSAPKKKNEKRSRVNAFLRDAFAGKHLLKLLPLWIGWIVSLFLVLFVSVQNENSIDNKEKIVREKQSVQDSLMRELKKINEAVYAENNNDLYEQAATDGYERVKEYDYYKVTKK